MAISQDGFAFFGLSTGLIRPEDAFEVALISAKFMGLLGEAHIVDQPKGRNLGCEIFFDGYATRAALFADLATLDSQVGTLIDALTQTIGGDVIVFNQCTFLGWTGDPKGPFYDASNPSTPWTYFCRLHWRQRSR